MRPFTCKQWEELLVKNQLEGSLSQDLVSLWSLPSTLPPGKRA